MRIFALVLAVLTCGLSCPAVDAKGRAGVRALVEKADAHHENWEFAEAVLAYEKALATGAPSARLHMKASRSAHEMSAHARALYHVEKALQIGGEKFAKSMQGRRALALREAIDEARTRDETSDIALRFRVDILAAALRGIGNPGNAAKGKNLFVDGRLRSGLRSRQLNAVTTAGKHPRNRETHLLYFFTEQEADARAVWGAVVKQIDMAAKEWTADKARLDPRSRAGRYSDVRRRPQRGKQEDFVVQALEWAYGRFENGKEIFPTLGSVADVLLLKQPPDAAARFELRGLKAPVWVVSVQLTEMPFNDKALGITKKR